ncbi:MAG TPA: long-chain fatty acid--CoA ligase [Ktedonobacterales bacterium]
MSSKKEAPAEGNLAQLFRNRSAKFAGRVRWKQKQGGEWLSKTWTENQQLVNRVIAGLDEIGARPGDVIGIASGVRWEWTVADWGILGLGAATVTLYPSNVPDVNAFILGDSGARYVFAENKAQYDKLASIRDQIPNVAKVILFQDAHQVHDDWVMSFGSLVSLSQRTPEELDAFAAERAAAIQPDDLLTLVYTSGTTGMPKGVVHTHATFMAQLGGAKELFPQLGVGMVDVLFLPLAHVFGRLESLVGVDRGFTTVYVPNIDDLLVTMQETHPDILFSVPRVYEKLYAAIQANVAKGSKTQQRIFHWAERVGTTVSRRREHHKLVGPWLRLKYAVANRLVFNKIRKLTGGKLRLALTGAAPLDLKILEFFNAAGTTLLEGWGLTETAAGFTINDPNNYRMGTIGRPYPGLELKIADDGEILVRGPVVFKRYNNNPEATAEAIDADGWFHTGDVGTVDKDGFVKIIDRKKDLIITAGGKNIGPQNIENAFKQVPLVSQVCVYGDRKPYLVGLFTLDPVALKKWADDNGIQYSDLGEVYSSPQLRAYLTPYIDAVNKTLASYETVKYWDILPEDFTIENGLLTPTLKIRRKAIYQRYGDKFEALYQMAGAPAAAAG